MPHDGQAELLGLAEERPVLAVLRIKMLINRPELEALELESFHTVLELLNAVGLSRVY